MNGGPRQAFCHIAPAHANLHGTRQPSIVLMLRDRDEPCKGDCIKNTGTINICLEQVVQGSDLRLNSLCASD
jgi:hypothetical protein